MTHRVFIGLTEVAGYFSSLRQGLIEAGVEATFVDESDQAFQYGGARRPMRRILVAERYIHRRRASSHSTGAHLWAIAAWCIKPFKLLYRVGLLTWAAARHDVFVFGGEQSFLYKQVDLRLLRLLRKRVIWVFTGSDHRPPYLSGRMIGEFPAETMAERAAEVRARVMRIEQHAVVVGHLASAQFHTLPLVRFLAIGIPLWRSHLPQPTSTGGESVVVVHSPSDPVSKGSAVIRAAVAALEMDGMSLDYQEIVGRPNSEVLNAIAAADLVVDEVFSDTPMGVLAAEAALLGKPTLVGGYYASHVSTDHPPGEIPPSSYVAPDAIRETLANLLGDRGRAATAGKRASAFVNSRWSLRDVASRFMQLAEGTAPASWWTDPMKVTYVRGWGIAEGELRRYLRRYVEQHGVRALGLDHNRQLRAQLLTFINARAEVD